MKRNDVMLTPEEARVYEKMSVLEAQKAAQYKPVASTDNISEHKATMHRNVILAAKLFG